MKGVLIGILCLFLWVQSSLALTIAQEKKMGREFFKEVKKQVPLISDPVLNAYYNKIGQSLVSHLSEQNYAYHFFLINQPTLNAFSGPGGYIFMYRGLFLIFDTEDELAAVTAHEIGHVVNRHIAERLERNKKLSLAALVGILAGTILGGGSPELATGLMTASVAATMAMGLKYSRQDEEQADRTGLQLLIESGYNGEAMVSAFKKLARFSLEGSGTIPAYLKTHPDVDVRIVYIASALKNMGVRSIKRDQTRFQLMQARMRALYTDREEAKGYFQYLKKKNNKNPVPFYGLGLCLMQDKDWQEAIANFKEALSLHDSFLFKRDLGICYAELGQYKEAVSYLREVPLDVQVAFYLGWAYQNLGNLKKAIATWQAALKHYDPDITLNTSTYTRLCYYLGQAYAANKQQDWAHYYIGLYFQLKGEMPQAQYHFKKAMQLTHDPKLKDLISKKRQ
jgi:predicted Zn-dependent protease